MDSNTRMHVRRQIDAANRKKLGLPARRAAVVVQHGDAARKWTDEEVVASLREIAKREGVPVTKLTLAAYRRHRSKDPLCGLSINALRPRLAAGISNLPRKLA